MRIFLIGLLLSGLLLSLNGEDRLQPEFDIPSTIAKLPEQSDFYGSWLRADGTYKLKIEPGDEAGLVVVQYFNPQPINVESAIFEEIEEQPRLEFVLRDEGYPGSAYRLIFYPEQQLLVGTYARPGAEPSEVYFIKQ